MRPNASLMAVMLLAGTTMNVHAQETTIPLDAMVKQELDRAKHVMIADFSQGFKVAEDLDKKLAGMHQNREVEIGRARIWLMESELFYVTKQRDKGEIFQKRAIKIAEKYNDDALYAALYANIADSQSFYGETEKALGNYQTGYRYAIKSKDNLIESSILQSLGMIYLSAQDYKKASDYFDQSIKANSEDVMNLYTMYLSLGSLADSIGNNSEAVKRFRQAKSIGEKVGSIVEIQASTFESISLIKMGEMTAAEPVVMKLEKQGYNPAFKKFPNAKFFAPAAFFYLKKGDAKKALFYVEKIFGNTGYKTEDINTNQIAYEVYKANGLEEKAIRKLEEIVQIKDKSAKIAIDSKNAVMSAEFDLSNQKLKISQMESDNIQKKNYIFLGIAAIFAFIAAMVMIFSYKLNKSKNRFKKTNKELQHAILEIQERIEKERQADQRARHDTLTGLPNRRHLESVISQDPDRPGIVMLLDLDRFKPINDMYGHDVGDAVLIEAGRRFSEIADKNDGEALRLGGDEFLVVFKKKMNKEESIEIAQTIVTSISNSFQVDDRKFSLGCSIGIASYPDHGLTIPDLLRCADYAMYEAKHAGRNTARYYDEAIGDKLQKRMRLEDDLRNACARGEIEAYFQPIINLGGGEIVGYEALARWNHPEHGMISPDDFIGMAEETGVIEDITTHILQQACRAARTWDPKVYVAVNMSPVLFQDDWLTVKTFGMLQKEGLHPSRLVIELTETAVVHDMDHAFNVISAFREAGIKVSLDDFGTGYSSLTTLKKLPFDNVKLDASFVSTMEDPSSLKIVEAVRNLTAAMEITITAEGVENEDVANWLKTLNFDEAQGYLYGKPKSLENTNEEKRQMVA
jgi:diguanylate cyclase (GGDEF)-like protein